MSEGPVVVQRQQRDAPRSPPGAPSNVFQGINITDSRAHLGNNYVSHNYYDSESTQRAILEQLSQLHYHNVHRHIQQLRLADTGSWLLDSGQYLQWRDEAFADAGRSHSLWCHGPPGVGKTFLASHIVDDIRVRTKGQQYAFAYLYANRDRGFEQSISSYLSCLARQLVEMVSPLEKAAFLDVVKSHNSTKDSRTPSILLTLLRVLALRFERVYIVLDALDEFSDDPDDRLSLLQAFTTFQCAAEPGVVRICMTSRQSSNCERLLSPQWSMTIESADEDLIAFIQARITASARLHAVCRRGPGGLLHEIVEHVTRSSGGVFKVASLQMDVIARQISPAGVKATLRKLPAQADVYYQQALDRIERNEDFGPIITRMFGWLLTLHDSLTHQELAQAMGVEKDTPLDLEPDEIEVHLPTLIDMAEGLIVSYPSDRLPVAFAHETVRAFLQTRLVDMGNTDWNADIAQTYLRYMSLGRSVYALVDSCRDRFAPPKMWVTPQASYSLLLKAAASWAAYASAAMEDVSPLEHVLAGALRQATGSPLVLCCLHRWPSIIRTLTVSHRIDSCSRVYQFFSPLHIGVSLGSHEVVRSLLEATTFNINTRGLGACASDWLSRTVPHLCRMVEVGSAWHLEVPDIRGVYVKQLFRWHTQCVLRRRLALNEEQREDFRDQVGNAEDHDLLGRATLEPPFTTDYVVQAFGTAPLHLAVDGPRDRPGKITELRMPRQQHDSDVLKLFLDREDVDVNAVGFAGFTPLFVAIHNADVEAVHALLDRKDININLITRSDHALSFAIHRMCHQRYVSLTDQSILDEFAEASSSTFARRLRILQILLEHPGIEANQPDASDHNALDWLDFYRTLAANDKLHAFVDSKRDWVGRASKRIAAQVLDFYEQCDFPFDSVVGLLGEHGARAGKEVEVDDWLQWICPLPQRVHDEVSEAEVAKKRDDEGNVDEVFYLRVPFSDGREDVEVREKVVKDSDGAEQPP